MVQLSSKVLTNFDGMQYTWMDILAPAYHYEIK